MEPTWLEVVRRDLPIRGLPEGLDGATLLQLGDLHVGPRVDDDYIAHAFAVGAALRPDLVAVTGDWITYREPGVFARLATLLRGLPRGRLATVGILGNHDYGFEWRMPDVADRVVATAEAAGVRMLRNASVEVAGLRLVGVDDLWGPFFPRDWRVAAGDGVATLALCHNPDGADTPIWDGYDGWILAGHTHGGQCKPPFLPPPLVPVRNRRYTAGEIAVDARRTLYISRGVGYLYRVRFNARPELTLFRLRRAAA